jgi:hypothetical protein
MLQAWQEMAATTAAASGLHMPAWPSQMLRQKALLGFDHGRKQLDDA